MKILDICTVEFSFTGIPVHIRNFYNELKKNNHVDIVAPDFNYSFLKTMPLHNGTKLYKISRKKNPIVYLYKLSKLINKNDYDIVHIHGNSSTMSLELMACKKSNAVVIVHTHNTQYKAKVLNRLFKGYLLGHADLYFAASKEAGKKLYGKHSFYIINNGINENIFKFDKKIRTKIRNRLHIFDDQTILGHVGTFNEQKNQQFLLEIANRLDPKKYHFVLIGDGEKKYFIEKVKNKEMFTLIPTTPNVNQYYSAFDMFLFPSKWEGLGMVAVEAQISGLICLVSDNVPEAVKISSKISFLSLKDIDRWIYMIKTNTNKARQRQINIKHTYNIELCVNNLEKLYKQALIKKNGYK